MSVKGLSHILRLTPMQQQKYSDSELKWAQPQKNADGSYTITVKQILSGYLNNKDVNAFFEGYKRRRIYEKALAVLEEISKSMSFIEEQKEQNGNR